MPSGANLKRLDLILLPAVAAGLAIVCWGTFRLLPYWPWSACRLASMMRLRYGFPLYPPPSDPGINDWIYGPVGPLAYTPTWLASEPFDALRIAALLNALYFLVPPAAVFVAFLRSTGERALAAWGFVLTVAAMLMTFGLWYGAAVLHVDTPTLGLGVLSCLALVYCERPWPVALLCALAIWTKQTALPLALAQGVFVLWSRGLRRGLVYGGWLAATTIGLLAIFCGWFGAANLYHNLVGIPARYPFEPERLSGELPFAARNVWWVLPVILAAWKWAPPRKTAEAEKPVQLGWLLLWVAAVSLPSGVAALIKYGGAQNSLHSLAYLILGAALLAATLAARNQARIASIARIAVVVGALFIVGLKLERVFAYGYLENQWSGERHREAFEFVRSHPREAYFPWNPLVTLMGERRDYPFEGGYKDWLKTGDAPSPASLRAAFPATLKFVVYHEIDQSHEEMLAVFPDFARKQVSGPWIFHTPPTAR